MLNKSNRPKLKLHLQIHEISSIPLVTGQIFVKWHILHSTSGECRGKTDRVPIIDHKASWSKYERECTFKVGIGKGGVLSERMLIMEVWVDMISGRERFRIGNVAVNLSEYASVKSETRKYLLQESKTNSTVKVTISVLHVEGSREYTTPPLKKAQMFHGITGLLAENKDLPQISRGIEHHNSKQILHSPTQEMYRRTFAAQWRVQAGELAPGAVVEDIFKGGSGWTTEFAPSVPKLPDRTTHRRRETVSVQETRDNRPQASRRSSSGRYSRSHIPFNRPITPLSPDDQSDYDDDEVDGWTSRPELESRRMNHLRTSSIVSITPRQGHDNRQRRNVITSESWEREELELGTRSWVIPDLNVVEEKIEKRRLARESKSTNASSASFASAPGSSGKFSSTTTDKSTPRSVSLNGSIVSEAIVEDDEDDGGNKANGSRSADDTDDSG
jgi:hypothetical protein